MLFRNLFPYKRNEAKNYVVSKAMRRSPRARSSKPEPKTLVEQLENSLKAASVGCRESG